MKISLQELRAFEDFIQRVEDGTEYKFSTNSNHALTTAYYANHPHFLMTMGFDEYVAFKSKNSFKEMWFAGRVEETGQSIYRRPSGQWLLLGTTPEDRFGFFGLDTKESFSDFDYEIEIPLEDVFKRLYSIAGKIVEEDKTLWSPKLWTPHAQRQQSVTLLESTRALLTALKDENLSLSRLSWRQLEEIVAEILRASGLEIHVVKENPQGGRDIVARGELIPGQEPLMMAVEVKHRRIVDRPELDKALYQNRMFPALLFVTSGRFTAGVLREKLLPENQLRLFLKDGDALGDLISDYKLY